MTLRVGIAGHGVVGKRRHHFLDRRDDMRVVAVCDQSRPEATALDNGVRHHPHYRDLLDEGLDVLFVCLSNDVAAEVTVAGLEKGLHVFCEKPPGRDLADVVRVIEAERRHPGQKLMYGFNHRYHDSVKEALRLVRSGELGRVVNLRGVYGKSKFVNFGVHSDWRTRRDVAGGGILLDQGIHMVDLMRLFAGEFAQVKSFVANDYWNHDVEDNAYALMRTEAGVVAMLHSTATQWRHRFRLEITLTKGAITLSGILSGSKSYGAETLSVARVDPADDSGDPVEQTTSYDKDNSWAEEIETFARAIHADAPIESGSSKDAFETLRLVYRIYCADPEWQARWNLSDHVESFAP